MSCTAALLSLQFVDVVAVAVAVLEGESWDAVIMEEEEEAAVATAAVMMRATWLVSRRRRLRRERESDGEHPGEYWDPLAVSSRKAEIPDGARTLADKNGSTTSSEKRVGIPRWREPSMSDLWFEKKYET